MRALLSAALLVTTLVSTIAAAQDAPQALTIALEPMGDRDPGVVVKMVFRFANPRAITHAGLFLEGMVTQSGRVPRSFRLTVPRKGDKMIWNNVTTRNGETVRHTQWTLLPDQRNEVAFLQTFDEGPAQIDAWLVLDGDNDRPQTLVAKASAATTIAKTNRPFVEEEAVKQDDSSSEEPKKTGAVAIRLSRRKPGSRFVPVSVEVLPPVRRVEFWVGGKKIQARNAPPYLAEIDLGEKKEPVELRVIGYDAEGQAVGEDELLLGADGE